MKIGTFKIDITPLAGHPLCAGWYGIAAGATDPLYGGGLVLQAGDELPVVLCALDWAELSNRSHYAWREALAAAAGTTASRVAVHCVHPHCTPWPDEYAERVMSAEPGAPHIMDATWCAGVLERMATAVREAAQDLKPVTHLKIGRARVQEIASNRRILGEGGKVRAIRWTKTRDPEVRAEPEGLIDPFLKSISYWHDEAKLAVCHYYAVHPTSYEDAWVTPDFTGLARERRSAEDGGVPHFYFTECAGNITAGKYNDGARENREIFTSRLQTAMVESEASAQRLDVDGFEWRSAPISLPPRPDLDAGMLLGLARDPATDGRARLRAAIMAAYLERRELPIEVSALHFGDEASMVHLPGEAFMEYQKFAQFLRPGAMVMVPAYGDCGPGYICMQKSFEEGGYEPYDSFVAGESECILKAAIAEVMA